jgi:sugar/nucleoside kinase (ribokinase family)
VLFVGLSTLDVLYGVDRVPGANEKVVATWQDVCAGGPATNAAIACAHLGARTTLATAVGTHPSGAMLRSDLALRGVTLVDLAPGLDIAPPVSSVFIDGRTGDRAVVSTNASAWPPHLAPVDEAAFEHVGVLLVDGHHLYAAIQAARRAREAGITTVMDGGSWKPGLEGLLPHIDVAVCSADFRPPDSDGPEAVAALLRGYGVRALAITRGAEPVLCWEGERACSVPVPAVQVADTLGAGDVLHGAFCYHLAAAPDRFLWALEAAVAVASHSCTYRGTRAWMDGWRPPQVLSGAGMWRRPAPPPTRTAARRTARRPRRR